MKNLQSTAIERELREGIKRVNEIRNDHLSNPDTQYCHRDLETAYETVGRMLCNAIDGTQHDFRMVVEDGQS